MVMPSSGPISMAQAHAEFGLGYNLNAYYGCDAGVPTSGAISLGHLYGKKKRPSYNNYCLVFNNTSVGASYFAISEIEFRESVGGPKFATSTTYATASRPGTWFDGGVNIAEYTDGYIDQYCAVSTGFSTPKVLRQVALYVSQGNPGPRNLKIYGGNGSILLPNPPSMPGWDLLYSVNNPTQVFNGWATYAL